MLQASAAFFYRHDRGLVDWVYASATPSPAFLSAGAIDVATTGIEATAHGKWQVIEVAVAYAYLGKVVDYGSGPVDASFDALNYPRHRALVTVVVRPIDGLELRSDTDLRVEAPDALRHDRTDVALSAARLSYRPSYTPGLTVTAAVDNIFNLGFAQVPGVPMSRRRFGLQLSYDLSTPGVIERSCFGPDEY